LQLKADSRKHLLRAAPALSCNLLPLSCKQAYKQDPIFIEQLERQLLDFLAPSSKAPRLALGAMPKVQRALVHEYAEAGFGLVSHSTGNEPNRAVQVFKTPSSGGWRLLVLILFAGCAGAIFGPPGI
jgi:hypothetical protein